MADIAVPYTLTTPAGAVVFNDGSLDQFYISEIQGLGGRPKRTPQDPKPWGKGALSYPYWADARQLTIDGLFLITSTRQGNGIVVVRNAMEETLRVALDSIGDEFTSDVGTLVWTPQGQATRTLTVRNNVEVEFGHDQNYLVETFHFGLVAHDPDWAT